MYIPAAYRVDDRARAYDLIRNHGFATLVTEGEGAPFASHLPFLLDLDATGQPRLRSHLARANPQWTQFRPGKEVLVIFHGPHAYISPSWYVSKVAVPTWNYATVHVYGVPELIEDRAALRALVDETTEKYESSRPQPWRLEMPEAAVDGLLRSIVGFGVTVTRIETKFKLGQNRSAADQDGMLAALEMSSDAEARSLGAFIRRQRAPD
ncbi:MAG: FMN-binding negative transcriptional regulator [Opitutaceae bacterium]